MPYASVHNEGAKINRTSKKGKSYTTHIPQRQFIGDSPEVRAIIRENLDNFFKELTLLKLKK